MNGRAPDCTPSQAADLGSDYRHGVRHVRTAWHYSSWRDRCAWAGYYCLYAWDGYIYSYPWDDRPSAFAYARAGIAIAIDGRGRRLAPLVAAETAAHPRLSEL
jgi:hypothetical protein